MDPHQRLLLEAERRLTRQARQAFDRGLGGRLASPSPLAPGEVYGGAGANIQVGSPPAGEWIHLTATSAHLAGARDVLTFDTVVARSRFDSTPDAGTVVLPRTAVYEFELWFKWDAYLYGGAVEIEVDGTVVRTFPGETRVGREFEPWSASFVANAGDQLRVLITLPDGTSATCDAELVVAAVEPIKETTSEPAPDTGLTGTEGPISSNTDTTVTLPTGVTEGDLLVVCAFYFTHDGVNTLAGMSGWTLLWDTSSGGNAVERIWVKVADASDAAGATYTITNTATTGTLANSSWAAHALQTDVGAVNDGALVTDTATAGGPPASSSMQTAALTSGDYGLVVAFGYRLSTAGSRNASVSIDSPATSLSSVSMRGGKGGSAAGVVATGSQAAGTLTSIGVSGGTSYGRLLALPIS